MTQKTMDTDKLSLFIEKLQRNDQEKYFIFNLSRYY